MIRKESEDEYSISRGVFEDVVGSVGFVTFGRLVDDAPDEVINEIESRLQELVSEVEDTEPGKDDTYSNYHQRLGEYKEKLDIIERQR